MGARRMKRVISDQSTEIGLWEPWCWLKKSHLSAGQSLSSTFKTDPESTGSPHLLSHCPSACSLCLSLSAATGILRTPCHHACLHTIQCLCPRGLNGVPPKPTSTCQSLTSLGNKVFVGVTSNQCSVSLWEKTGLHRFK